MDLQKLKFSELVTVAVSKGELPRYIYKYRSINENTDKVFSKAQIWFSNPNTFNDPFDCQIKVQADNTIEEIANFLRTSQPDMTSKEIKNLSRHYSKNMHEWKTMVNGVFGKHINNTGICCFAGSGDNILMWSHYGDSHRGICLKFDLLADPYFFSVPLKVKYATNYPVYNHLKNSSTLIEDLIQTKSECWRYEEELRVLKTNAGTVQFKKEALVEVIFGCGCKSDDTRRIKQLIAANGFPSVKFKKAVVSKSSYKLEIKDLK